jgi:hypothetical protein
MAQYTANQYRSAIKFIPQSLGLGGVPVYAQGQMFFCTANFTLNKFIVQLCQWAKHHPDGIPSKGHIKKWVTDANRSHYVTGHGERINTSPSKKIVIQSIPDVLTQRMIMALNGGLLHESAHLLYTHQSRLDWKVMCSMVLPLWGKVKDWGKMQQALLSWTNLIEDIRIERLLRQNYANTATQLADLQDLILRMEGHEDGKFESNAKALQVICGTFRDIGLGYNTVLGRKAITSYKAVDQTSFDFVTKGALRPMLLESMKPDQQDGVKTLELALKVIVEIADLIEANTPDQPNQPQPPQPPQESKCPNCGAGARSLVIKALYEQGNSQRVKGKGVLCCTNCGHQQVIDIQEDTPDCQPQPNQPQPPQPRWEGFDGDDKADKPEDGQGDGSDGEQGEDTDGEGEGSGKGSKPPVFKVGDKAYLNGQEVVVVVAGEPDDKGVQHVEVEPV